MRALVVRADRKALLEALLGRHAPNTVMCEEVDAVLLLLLLLFLLQEELFFFGQLRVKHGRTAHPAPCAVLLRGPPSMCRG